MYCTHIYIHRQHTTIDYWTTQLLQKSETHSNVGREEPPIGRQARQSFWGNHINKFSGTYIIITVQATNANMYFYMHSLCLNIIGISITDLQCILSYIYMYAQLPYSEHRHAATSLPGAQILLGQNTQA